VFAPIFPPISGQAVKQLLLVELFFYPDRIFVN